MNLGEQDPTPLIAANTGSVVGLLVVLGPETTCRLLDIPVTDDTVPVVTSAGAWLLVLSYLARQYSRLHE
jgi:hypothetical protein